MPDPDTAIPVLTGAALAQGIAFLYGQAAELLRIRREDKTTQRTSPTLPEAFQPLNTAAVPDLGVLDNRARELRMLLQMARPYTTRPIADLDGADETLRHCFGHIREALEDVYSTRFSFTEERRGTLRVRQSATDLRGAATGMQIHGGDDAKVDADVIQRFETVHRGGEATGVVLDFRV
jgi:hypothetical protein